MEDSKIFPLNSSAVQAIAWAWHERHVYLEHGVVGWCVFIYFENNPSDTSKLIDLIEYLRISLN